jgi:hypothetical protein
MSKPKLHITKDIVEHVLQLFDGYSNRAHEFFPPSNKAVDLFATMKESLDKGAQLENTSEAKELYKFLSGFSLQQLKELQVMMYVGRGDYEAAQWEQACGHIHMTENKELEIGQLVEKTCLNDYLADGFERLNTARII